VTMEQNNRLAVNKTQNDTNNESIAGEEMRDPVEDKYHLNSMTSSSDSESTGLCLSSSLSSNIEKVVNKGDARDTKWVEKVIDRCNGILKSNKALLQCNEAQKMMTSNKTLLQRQETQKYHETTEHTKVTIKKEISNYSSKKEANVSDESKDKDNTNERILFLEEKVNELTLNKKDLTRKLNNTEKKFVKNISANKKLRDYCNSREEIISTMMEQQSSGQTAIVELQVKLRQAELKQGKVYAALKKEEEQKELLRKQNKETNYKVRDLKLEINEKLALLENMKTSENGYKMQIYDLENARNFLECEKIQFLLLQAEIDDKKRNYNKQIKKGKRHVRKGEKMAFDAKEFSRFNTMSSRLTYDMIDDSENFEPFDNTQFYPEKVIREIDYKNLNSSEEVSYLYNTQFYPEARFIHDIDSENLNDSEIFESLDNTQFYPERMSHNVDSENLNDSDEVSYLYNIQFLPEKMIHNSDSKNLDEEEVTYLYNTRFNPEKMIHNIVSENLNALEEAETLDNTQFYPEKLIDVPKVTGYPEIENQNTQINRCMTSFVSLL